MPPLIRKKLGEFLTGQPHIMKLATLTPDGWPYLVPVWYDYDGEDFLLAGRPNARWVDHIRHDPRVSVCIDTCDAPYTRVLIQGVAEVVDDSWYPSSPDRAVRYLGPEAGNRYFNQTRRIPRALVRVVPGEITSWAGSDWHPRYAV